METQKCLPFVLLTYLCRCQQCNVESFAMETQCVTGIVVLLTLPWKPNVLLALLCYVRFHGKQRVTGIVVLRTLPWKQRVTGIVVLRTFPWKTTRYWHCCATYVAMETQRVTGVVVLRTLPWKHYVLLTLCYVRCRHQYEIHLGLYVKCSILLSDVDQMSVFSAVFSRKSQISNFTKICPMEAALTR